MMDKNYWLIFQKQNNRNTKQYNKESKNKDELSNYYLPSLSLNQINNDETQICKTLITTNKSQQLEAKMMEPNQWQNEQVYHEIDDLGQQSIYLIWVMKEKVVTKKNIIKAHLCARSFKEEQNFKTDSPTCSSEGLWLPCLIMSSNQWTWNSFDVKTAFLKGNTIERTVFVNKENKEMWVFFGVFFAILWTSWF